MTYQTAINIGAILIAVSAIGGIYGAYMLQEGLTNKKKAKSSMESLETHKPDIKVAIFPSHNHLTHNNKSPLHEYQLCIQNNNVHTAEVTDVRIKFVFEHEIDKIFRMPIFVNGQADKIAGVRIIQKDNNQTYEDLPPTDAIANSFSQGIEQVNINGITMNTNIYVFSCSRWPRNAAFTGTVVVNQSNEPLVMKNVDSVGTYYGTYNYIIDGKVYEDNEFGKIPPITIEHH